MNYLKDIMFQSCILISTIAFIHFANHECRSSLLFMAKKYVIKACTPSHFRAIDREFETILEVNKITSFINCDFCDILSSWVQPTLIYQFMLWTMLQLLANEKELNRIVEKAFQEKSDAKDDLGSTEIIRSFLKRNTKELGLPLFEAGDAAVLLYDTVFADIAKEKDGVELDKEKLTKLMKDVLQKLAEQLELNPVYQDFA